MLSSNNLSAERNGQVLFKNLTFKVDNGTCLIVSGTNGSGKSTLLKIIAGLRTPNGGSVEFKGKNIHLNSEEYYKDLSYISHKNAMKPELTVHENLNFWAIQEGLPELAVAAMATFDIYDYSDYLFSELSEGLKRRVALSRLLCSPRRVWVLDEPTSNLDKESVSMFSELIKLRIHQGGIIILSSHSELEIPNAKELKISDFAAG